MAFPIETPVLRFLDTNGNPVEGGTITFYEPGTTTLKDTYPTYDDAQARTNPNSNPLTLDAYGQATVFGVSGEGYKLLVKDSDGVTLDTFDDIFLPGGDVVVQTLTGGGTAAAITASPSPSLSAYVLGDLFAIKPPGTNSAGAVTLNLNSLGAKSVVLPNGQNPYAGALDGSAYHLFFYDGTNFIILNPAFDAARPPAIGGTTPAAGAFTTLSSSGAASLNSLTVTTTLGVTGAVTLSSTLAVTGAITPTGGIAAAGGFSASPRCIHTLGMSITNNADGNNSTPVATETYIAELFVPCNMTITGFALFNGSVAAGNITIGLANSSGTPIAAAKSASTAMSGTDAFQRIPFATPYAAVGPATYFLQVQYSDTSARFNTHAIGNGGTTTQTSQLYGTLTSFTPPTTFTANVGPIATAY